MGWYLIITILITVVGVVYLKNRTSGKFGGFNWNSGDALEKAIIVGLIWLVSMLWAVIIPAYGLYWVVNRIIKPKKQEKNEKNSGRPPDWNRRP